MTPTRLRRIRAHINRIGYHKLIADAERIARAGKHVEAGRLRQALTISGCDDGVAVYEWYDTYWTERLGVLSGAFLDAPPRSA